MKAGALAVVCTSLLAISCHYKGNEPQPQGPNEPAVFNFSPLEKAKINFIFSLGWIQPSGHTLPTDHIYFYFTHQPTNPPLPVHAPGGGVINKILVVPVLNVKECKVWVKMNDKFMYYLDHIVPHDSLREGSVIHAGQDIGTSGVGTAIDLGVIDYNVTLNFANPKRYVDEMLHCGKPLAYFADSLKAGLYAKVDREGVDKDGQIDIDVVGRLVGNWFLDGSTFYTDGPDGWDKELSFAFDFQHPARVLVSIGGTLGLTGKWGIPYDAPLPADVSEADGKVAYRLLYIESLSQAGLMIVQLLDSKHIKVEVFPNLQDSSAEFDSKALVYAR